MFNLAVSLQAHSIGWATKERIHVSICHCYDGGALEVTITRLKATKMRMHQI